MVLKKHMLRGAFRAEVTASTNAHRREPGGLSRGMGAVCDVAIDVAKP